MFGKDVASCFILKQIYYSQLTNYIIFTTKYNLNKETVFISSEAEKNHGWE